MLKNRILLWNLLTLLAMMILIQPVLGQDEPPPVRMDTVSISTTGDIVFLSWYKSTVNTSRYVIERADGFLWDSIGGNNNLNDTSFLDLTAGPCAKSSTYVVLAINDQGQSSYIPDSKELKTIHFYPPQYEACAQSIELKWTSYIHMNPELGGYWVYISENEGPFYKLTTTGPGDTTWSHTSFGLNTKYTYYIRAFNNLSDTLKTSSSCRRDVFTDYPALPGDPYINLVTVENNTYVKLDWAEDQQAQISKYIVQRSENGFSYDTIAEIDHQGNFQPATTYIDSEAEFNSQSYYYRIKVCDACGVERGASINPSKTVFLQGIPSSDGERIELSWNEYEGWTFSGIREYRIYRKIDGVANPVDELGVVPDGTTSFADDISQLSDVGGVFSYVVHAIENDGVPPFGGQGLSSISNEVEITNESGISIPNAFTPGRDPKPEFKPETVFVDAEGYQMLIFNKWGQLIFESDNLDEGWDGNYKGQYVTSGAYVYLISCKTFEGQKIEKKGTVTVIR
nr:gliding motility-associated C-terminal domain-containing protein [Bacteroidota bacterium]